MSHESIISIVNIPKEYDFLDVSNDELIKYCKKVQLEIYDQDNKIINFEKLNPLFSSYVYNALSIIKKEYFYKIYIYNYDRSVASLLMYHGLISLCSIKKWLIQDIYVCGGEENIIYNINEKLN